MPTETIEPLFTHQMIQARVAQLGQQITSHYRQSHSLTLIALLRGSFIFIADLTRQIKLPHEIDFMLASSYGNNVQSSRTVHIAEDMQQKIANKDVLLVEDIVDTGLTLQKVYNMLSSRAPKSLKICTLLDKPHRREVEVPVEWVGFTIPDRFVVGYGIDYAQRYRHLDFIGALQSRQTPCVKDGPR